MGHLVLGLVLVGSLLLGTGPEPVAVGHPTTDVVVKAAPQRDACGPRLKKPNGRLWRCSFVDNFARPKLNGKHWKSFRDKEPIRKTSTCRRPRNVRVAKGQLLLSVKSTGDAKGCRYTVGAVSTYHRFSQKYGRFEARVMVRATREPGLHEAFWLWPDNRVKSNVKWPAAGEIDVVETYSQYPDIGVPYLHYTRNDNGGPKPGVNTAWDCKLKRGKWHTYTLLWAAKRIEIKIDGRSCLINKSGDRAFKKKYIVALTQSTGLRRNRPTAKTALPATMRVDYVKVWR